MSLDQELEEVLRQAAEKEEAFSVVSQELIKKYRQLERMGYLFFDQKAMGMGIVSLTKRGREYLDQ